MTTQFLTTAAQNGANQWGYILPEILLAGLALLLLVFEVILPPTLKRHIPTISIIAQLGILAVTICVVMSHSGTKAWTLSFYGMLMYSATAQFMRVFFVVISILVHALAMISLPKQRVPRTEFFHIVLIITAAMMLLAQSAHFLMLFVALETVTVGFYILVSYYRTQPLSLEAGLKYLILGALSSGLLLFGIVLLYGVAGNPSLNGIIEKVGSNSDPLSMERVFVALAQGASRSFLGNLGALLVLSGVAFKIGLVPFQIWIPDVYQGAPTPVTAFLSVGSKTAGFAVLLVLLGFFAPCYKLVWPFLMVLTFATIIFGNLAALTQHNVKRLMGLSGVSHAGFIMMALLAWNYTKDAHVLLAPGVAATGKVSPHMLDPIFLYLTAYALATFAVFGVMTLLAGENDANQELSDYHGLAKRSPFLAGVLAIGLASLAGIPPLFGFTAKLLVFINVFRAGLYPLLAVAILAVVVSIYYYFGWIRAAFFTHWDPTPAPPIQNPESKIQNPIHVPLAMKALLAALALASILLGLWQTPIMKLLALLGLS